MKWEGKIVDLYDMWWSPSTIEGLEFWCHAATEAISPRALRTGQALVVELCSGTGRILIPVIRRLMDRFPRCRVRAVGLDYSREMNAKLSQKIADDAVLKPAITVKAFDIADENWSSVIVDASVDLVLYPFNHFAQMGAPAEQETIVRNISSCLAAGGTLILQDYCPGGSRLRDNNQTIFKWMVSDEEQKRVLFYWRRSWPLDRSHQYAQVHYKIDCLEAGDAGFRCESFSAIERICYRSLDDLTSLFGSHGLHIERVYGDSQGKPLSETSEVQFVIAKKTSPRSEAGAAAGKRS